MHNGTKGLQLDNREMVDLTFSQHHDCNADAIIITHGMRI